MTTFTVCIDVHWSVRSVNGPLACNCWTTISRQSATCLLRKRTFGKSVVVSIAISRLDCIDLISVDSVAKINRLYHRNVSPIYSQPAIVTASDLTALLETSLTVRQSAGHRARETVELLRRETLQSISPANSLDLSPLDYRIWGRRTYIGLRISSANPGCERHVAAVYWDIQSRRSPDLPPKSPATEIRQNYSAGWILRCSFFSAAKQSLFL